MAGEPVDRDHADPIIDLVEFSRRFAIEQVLAQLGELQQQVIDENAMDLALYQLAGQRLDQLVEEVPDFEEKLVAFRERCATVQAPRQ